MELAKYLSVAKNKNNSNKGKTMTSMHWKNPPEMQIDPKKSYQAKMETSKGLIEIELYPEHAPKTVNNFVFLAKEGY